MFPGKGERGSSALNVGKVCRICLIPPLPRTAARAPSPSRRSSRKTSGCTQPDAARGNRRYLLSSEQSATCWPSSRSKLARTRSTPSQFLIALNPLMDPTPHRGPLVLAVERESVVRAEPVPISQGHDVTLTVGIVDQGIEHRHPP